MTRRPPRRRLPHDWNGLLLIALALASFAFGVIGFRHYLGIDASWPEVFYQSLQLFFLNFEKVEGAEINFWLQMARFGAFIAAVWTILKAFFPQVLQHCRRWMRLRGKSCAVILGYGPVGQAIGAALWQRGRDIRRVTAVHPAITPELATRARMDGVLLIEGDPSDPRVLDRVFTAKAERVYVSDPDDLRAIDMVVAVRQHIASKQGDIRVILNDSATAAQMAEASDTGYFGTSGVMWFSVADETARLLIADARFDRHALESGAERMHLAIIGCGSQGEAIAVEALLTAWRVGLGPPKISFLDRDAAAVEARMRRRMPAWFLQPEGRALYPAARPDLEFLTCDAATIDFARDPCIESLRTRVSGWVFSTGDDALNLRASLALHRAIMARQIDPAPIYVRIPTGHVDEAPELSGNRLSLAHTFGAVDNVMARSALLAQDPDALPKLLHAEYAATAVKMGLADTMEDWTTLPETKRDANRSLFRHAAMKIEDFEAVAVRGHDGILTTHPQHSTRIDAVDECLAYDRITAGTDVHEWLKDGQTFSEEQEDLARLIRDAAVCEHNRWTIERALAQFVPTERPERELRDDVRRLHDNMHDWYALSDARTRRYDIVMLRALLSAGNPKARPKHGRARSHALFLSVDAETGTCQSHLLASGTQKTADASDLHLYINATTEPTELAKLVPKILDCIKPHVDRAVRLLPTRVRFDFTRPPTGRTLALANLVADELRELLPETVQVDSLWIWHAAGGPVVGVVGHRDLTRFGGVEPVTEALRQIFMDLIERDGIEQMVTGFAPGTDRAAVQAWASLGLPKPVLVFPYEGRDEADQPTYFTEDPTVATEETSVSVDVARKVGIPLIPATGEGHEAQAEDLLRFADVLVFVVDEDKEVLNGGTRHTLARARNLGKRVIVIGPDASGCTDAR